MKRCAIGYLTYITEKNKDKRINDFYKSLKSLHTIDYSVLDIISIDNSSLDEVKNLIKDQNIFSKYFFYNKNYYDTALFFTTLWYAKERKIDYICFLYDDSIIFDDAFNDTIKFMDQNKEITCTRISSYDFENQSFYDAEKTPKSKNPDAIRHYNFITNEKLNWKGPFFVGDHVFYQNNWHYTSRPIIWRVNFFDQVISSLQDSCRVLQGFEQWAQQAFDSFSIKTGVLNKGMIKTTPVMHSARGLELSLKDEYNLTISQSDLRKSFEEII